VLGPVIPQKIEAFPPSFASPTGFIVYSHAGDDRRDCRDHVATLLGMKSFPASDPGPCRRQAIEPPADWSASANELWKSGIEPRGTIAERYLKARSLEMSDDIANSVVRRAGGAMSKAAWFSVPSC